MYICDVFLCELDDDQHSSRLLTLFAHYTSVLVMFNRNSISSRTQAVMKTLLMNCKKDALSKGSQILTAENTLKQLKEKYFNRDEGKS